MAVTTTSSIDEVVERLADTAAALMLLRFRSAKLPLALAARLEARHPELRFHVLAYQADAEEFAPGSAIEVVRHCAELAAEEPPPALLLFPRYPEDGTLSPEEAIRFWKHLNGQRELLGNLAARVLLGVDPKHEPYAVAYAKDLLSWCAPKYSLPFDEALEEAPALELSPLQEARSSSSLRSTDEDVLAWSTLWPIWQEIVDSGKAPTNAAVEQIGVPLLAAAVSTGRFRDAREIERAISAAEIPTGRVRGVLLCLKGMISQDRGDFDDADRSFHHALALQEELLRQNPKSDVAKWDLAATIERWVDFLSDRGWRGDSMRVLDLSLRELRISEQVLSTHPDSPHALRVLALSHVKVAESLALQGRPGDSVRARSHFERGVSIAEKLYAAFPDEPGAAQVLLTCLASLGHFLSTTGDADDAKGGVASYQRIFELSERRMGANPGSVLVSRDLSLSLDRIVELLALRGAPGDAERALAHYSIGVDIHEQLLAEIPGSIDAARRLLMAIDRLVIHLVREGSAGSLEKARLLCARSLQISERLLDANPESIQALGDMVVSLERSAFVHAMSRGPESAGVALGYQQRASMLAHSIYERMPTAWRFVRLFVVNQVQLYGLASAAGRHEVAIAASDAARTALTRASEQGLEMDQSMRELLKELDPASA